MNKSRLLLLGLCLAALLLPLPARLDAQDARSLESSPLGADRASQVSLAPQAGVVFALKGTVWNVGATGPGGAGFVALDVPTVLQCKKTTSCIYEVLQYFQGSSSTASNRFALCTTLDGVYMPAPNCAYLGLIPNDGFFHGGAFAGMQLSVPPGTHTLQTFLYTDNGVTVANWGVVYNVYNLMP